MGYLTHKLRTNDVGDIDVESSKGGGKYPPCVYMNFTNQSTSPNMLKLSPREAIRLGAMLISCGDSVLEEES